MKRCKVCGKKLRGILEFLRMDYLDSCHLFHKGVHHSCYHKPLDRKDEVKEWLNE